MAFSLPTTNQYLNPKPPAPTSESVAAENAAGGLQGRLARDFTNVLARQQPTLHTSMIHGNSVTYDTQNSIGKLWDTTLDANVGELDKKIADANRYAGSGSSLYSPEDIQKLQAQRALANAARWRSANLTGSPGRDQLRQALADGSLSYEDLGNIDITALNDDAALSGQISALLKAKLAPPAVAPTPAAPDDGQAAANQATTDVFTKTKEHLNDLRAGLATYDQGTLDAQNKIASNASALGRKIGGADAGALANNLGTANAANQAAGRKILEQKDKNDLDSFINDAVTKAVGGTMDATEANSAKGLAIQGQAMDSLLDEIKKTVSSTDEAAQKQINQLNDAIAKFKTAQAGSVEQNNERAQILALTIGLVGAGLGTAAGGPFGGAAGGMAGQAAGKALSGAVGG